MNLELLRNFTNKELIRFCELNFPVSEPSNKDILVKELVERLEEHDAVTLDELTELRTVKDQQEECISELEKEIYELEQPHI